MNAGFPIYRLQCTLEGHKHEVTSVKFSPCGQSIASCCYDNTIKIWDAAGKLKSELVDAEKARFFPSFTCIRDVDWSNDGSLIANASDWLKIWNVNTGECVKLLGNEHHLFRASFSPDDSLIVAGCTTTKYVYIWDVESEVCINTFDDHHSFCTSVDFDNQTSRFLTSNADQFCLVYDLRSMDIVQSIHAETVISFARFSPDSRNILFGTWNNTISLFDLRKNKVARTYQGHRDEGGRIYATFSSTSGRYIVSGSQDSMIYIWDTNTQELLEVLGGHSGGAWYVNYHPEEDIILSGAGDRTFKIWKSS